MVSLNFTRSSFGALGSVCEPTMAGSATRMQRVIAASCRAGMFAGYCTLMLLREVKRALLSGKPQETEARMVEFQQIAGGDGYSRRTNRFYCNPSGRGLGRCLRAAKLLSCLVESNASTGCYRLKTKKAERNVHLVQLRSASHSIAAGKPYQICTRSSSGKYMPLSFLTPKVS